MSHRAMPAPSSEGAKVALCMRDIIKDFPGVRALDRVNLVARYGEILALIGENGAGKSTLMKVLSGVIPFPHYGGELMVDGERQQFVNAKVAEKAGIAIIHQELNLIPQLSVAENIFLDRPPRGCLGFIDWPRLHNEAAALLATLASEHVPTTARVVELSVAGQQMVEIAKALSLSARIVVLDEPTSALTEQEVDRLMATLDDLRRRGVCIIFISHRLEEVRRLADRICVLRDGRTIGPVTEAAQLTQEEIIRRMVGRDIDAIYPQRPANPAETILDVRNLSVEHPSQPGRHLVRDVSFRLARGEVVGVAGLMGAGRTALVAALFGCAPAGSQGEIRLDGRPVAIRSPQDAIAQGIALVPEDRKQQGLILGLSVLKNMTLPALWRFVGPVGHIDEKAERREADNYVRRLAIKASTIDADVDQLSGGNQQKVVLAKWLMTDPKVLILDEPTRGIDVGAKAEIYKLINTLVQRGMALIVVSSELDEVIGLCDRILVMRSGRLAGTLNAYDADRERIMHYATGATTQAFGSQPC